jgi:hypothetical protein
MCCEQALTPLVPEAAKEHILKHKSPCFESMVSMCDAVKRPVKFLVPKYAVFFWG